MSDTATLVRTEIETVVVADEQADPGDVAHYVISPDPEESNHAYVMRARIEGFEVEALCGFVWVPQKMATGLPVCLPCREVFDMLPDDGGGDPRE